MKAVSTAPPATCPNRAATHVPPLAPLAVMQLHEPAVNLKTHLTPSEYVAHGGMAAFFVVFTLIVVSYMITKFVRGRRQMRRNCDVIGKQLAHLQRVIEEGERKERERAEGRSSEVRSADGEEEGRCEVPEKSSGSSESLDFWEKLKSLEKFESLEKLEGAADFDKEK